jgi:preprotein translocase subunit Sec63
MWWFRPTLVRSLLALMTVLLFLSPVNAQRTSSFYDTVNDIATGIDYYEVLDVSPQASERDIKKAFRTLGMK